MRVGWGVAVGTKEEKQPNKSVGLIITRLHLFFFFLRKNTVGLEPVLPSKHPAVKVETLRDAARAQFSMC